jgi:hypothetical protein
MNLLDFSPDFSPELSTARADVTLAGPELGQILVWSPWYTFWAIAGPISAGLCAYHGYKRTNGSAGWTAGWALFGAVLPIVAPAVALAQGFGQPEKG